MSTLKEQVSWQYRYLAEQSARYLQIENVLGDLGLLDVNTYDVYFTTYGGGPTVEIRPKHVLGLLADFQTIVDTTPTLADAARFWLPKVGKWEKGFDGTNNEITMTAEYKGVKIVLKDKTPATCTVEKVEEEVEVPASSYKRTRFVLKGDCDPLMAGLPTAADLDRVAEEAQVAKSTEVPL